MILIDQIYKKEEKLLKQFNLVDEPWIKVIVKDTYDEKIVSLIDLFTNSTQYLSLAGEMPIQNLAILRLLLAILTTAYSRKNFEEQDYKWLKLVEAGLEANDAKDELQETWEEIYENNNFSSTVLNYLKEHKSEFDFFGEHPFYQVTRAEYDALVPTNKNVASGKGTVSVKQINRRISESNNTPAIFSPTTGEEKNKISLDELIRWIITYQNITGVTDKTKIITTNKYSNSNGWMYSIEPVYIKGKNLFETLLLNLKLDNTNLQQPVWETDLTSYIQKRLDEIRPNNIAELYSLWSRILHIEWNENNQPTIFSAGLPGIDGTNYFVEPMTTWKKDGKKDSNVDRPKRKSKLTMDKAIWRNFGDYTISSNSNRAPGIVKWLYDLIDEDILPEDFNLELASVGMVSDGNATSQAPYAEIANEMALKANVFFDNKENGWINKISKTVELTQTIGSYYWYFLKDLNTLSGLKDSAGDRASKESRIFYSELNTPFLNWLASINVTDNQAEKVIEWKKQLYRIALNSAQERFNRATNKEFIGKYENDKNIENIFTLYNKFKGEVNKKLRS